MPNWDSKEFDSRGAELARVYFAVDGGGADLTSLVTKVARDNSLNPEQIRRLARAANKCAFEQKYAALKGNPDGRVVDFDVANEEAVIGQLHADAAPSRNKTASVNYPDLPDDRAPAMPEVEVFPVTPQMKVASAREDAEAIRRNLGIDHPDREALRMEKAASEYAVREKSAERRWEDTMHLVEQATRRVYWDHDTFEKNALALHGAHILPELNALRSQRKMPELSLSAEKIAAVQDRVLAEDDEWTQRLRGAADAREEFLRVKAARVTAEERLRELHDAVRRGG